MPEREDLEAFIQQIERMPVVPADASGPGLGATTSLALESPLLLLVALSLLARGGGPGADATSGRRSIRLDELAAPFRAVWPGYGGPGPGDAASAFRALARQPFWVPALRDPRAAQLEPATLMARLAGDRAARLDAAEAILGRWWPIDRGRSLARALGLDRTHRFVVIGPDELAPCLASGTWGARDYLALRDWRSGDRLLFHVKQVGRLRATAIATRDPYDDPVPSWQDTPRRTYPRRIAFRVTAQLAGGVATRDALAPHRRGEPANWFKGFVGTSHVLKPEDAFALLDAFARARDAGCSPPDAGLP